MRELIGAIPDGTYSFDDQLDECGTEHGADQGRGRVTVAGDEITVDFSRRPQMPLALNSDINYTRAYRYLPSRCSPTRVPQNAGMLRPINVMAREGSFFNPRESAPSGGRAINQSGSSR